MIMGMGITDPHCSAVPAKAGAADLLELRTQQHLRPLQDLPFCYLCGKDLDQSMTRDHVIASSLIRSDDRSPPLILPAHGSCNGEWSAPDGQMAELIGHLHGRDPHPVRSQLEYVLAQEPRSGGEVGGVTGINLERLIIRWVRGFHAALYRRYLPGPELTQFFVSPPFPAGTLDAKGNPVFESLQIVHAPICRALQVNRLSHRVDRVEIYNSRCVYECTWDSITQHGLRRPACLFGLKLYNWHDLGATPIAPKRGCLGLYVPRDGRPTAAATTTLIDTSAVILDNLNPFASAG